MGAPLIAVVIEDSTQRSVLEHLLHEEGFEVTGHGGEASLFAASRSRLLAGILVDAAHPGWVGGALPVWIQTVQPRTPLVLLGPSTTSGTDAEALLRWPWSCVAPAKGGTQAVLAVRRVLEAARLDHRVRSLERRTDPSPWGGLVGRSPALRELVDDLDRIAPTETTVVIRGEPGVGKGLVARALHAHSGRREGPFLVADGGRLDEGWPGGLRSDPSPGPAGPSEAGVGALGGAGSGTLLLEGVDALSSSARSRLLDVVAEEEATPPVEASEARPFRFRLLVKAAPRREPESGEGGSRAFLERLGGVEVRVPPLRERRQDIPLLVAHFARMELSGQPPPAISPEAMDRLFAYPWPGNLGELRSTVQRALTSCDGEIRPEDLPQRVLRGGEGAARGPGEPDLVPPDTLELRALERWAIRRAVAACRGNLSEAAQRLGIGRTTLYRKLESYGLR